MTHRNTAFRLLIAALCLILCVAPLTACGGNYRNDLTAAQVGETVVAALPTGEGRHTAGNGFISSSTFGEDYQTLLDKTDGYVIYVSDLSDTNIDEVGVFHVTAAGDVKALEKIVKEYIEAQKLRLSDLLDSYNPGEKPKLSNAKVTVRGNYILYTILSDSDTAAAKTAFENALKAE